MSSAPRTSAGLQRLVEQRERDDDGEERRRPHDDRGARRARLAHGQREEELRQPRPEQPGEQERPHLAQLQPLRDREGQRDRRRRGDGQHGAELGVRDAREREAQRDRHEPEQAGGGEREQDGVHGRRDARRGWRNVARRLGATAVPRQGRRERSYPEGTGATEDAASGRPACSGGTAWRFASPSLSRGAAAATSPRRARAARHGSPRAVPTAHAPGRAPRRAPPAARARTGAGAGSRSRRRGSSASGRRA